MNNLKLRKRFKNTEFFYYIEQRIAYQIKAIRFKRVPWRKIDKDFFDIFLSEVIPDHTRYDELFKYLLTGYKYYRSTDFAHIYYPGAMSRNGAEKDAMEGFCRILPMISAWLYSGRSSLITDFIGNKIDLLEVVKTGLLAGTNPKSNGYWGDIKDYDPKIVGASDIALSIWLTRNVLLNQISSKERELITKWLMSFKNKKIHDNNWQVFPLIINEVLISLGLGGDHEISYLHYKRLKDFYRGSGWFSDGPEEVYDYYNAWGFHYALFWINQINPEFAPEFIKECQNNFVKNFKFFFSTKGFPITGRSICYRMAAPAPLVAAATEGLSNIGPGMARRALDCVWRFFIKNGAVSQGTISQGYFDQDLKLLDNYSGPGSSMWSTRSLVIAFYNSPNSKFWTLPQEKLPIEKGDYQFEIPEVNWEIKGLHASQEIQIIKKGNINKFQKIPDKISLKEKIQIYMLGLPFRLDLYDFAYKMHTYSSLFPFWMSNPSDREEAAK